DAEVLHRSEAPAIKSTTPTASRDTRSPVSLSATRERGPLSAVATNGPIGVGLSRGKMRYELQPRICSGRVRARGGPIARRHGALLRPGICYTRRSGGRCARPDRRWRTASFGARDRPTAGRMTACWRQAEQAARDVDGVGGHLRRPAPVDVERVPRRVDSPHDDAIRRDGFRAGRRPAVSFTTQSNWFGYVLPPQIAFAARTTTSSLRRWSSIEMRFPRTDVEKPHCGLSARRSRGTTRLASRRRLSRPSTVSTRADFVVTRPRTTVLSSGTSRSASNEPERSSSYSR